MARSSTIGSRCALVRFMETRGNYAASVTTQERNKYGAFGTSSATWGNSVSSTLDPPFAQGKRQN